MRELKDIKFDNACRAIFLVLEHFDDEVFDREEQSKDELRMMAVELLERYRR